MKVEQVSAKICAMFIVREQYLTNLQVVKIIKNMCIFLYMLRKQLLFNCFYFYR